MQALKKTQTWPPSQWYLDRFTELPDPAILHCDQQIAPNQATSTGNFPASITLNLPTHDDIRGPPTTSSQASLSETESVKAASVTATWGTPYPSSADLSSPHSRLARSRTSLAGGSRVPQKKASFRESHIKRWSRDMSKTSRKVARHLGLSRKSKERQRDLSPDSSEDIPRADSPSGSSIRELSRGRSSSRRRHSSHEMSEISDTMPVFPIPPPLTTLERRSGIFWEDLGRGRTVDIPRRDLLDLSGGIQAAAGMPHQVRKRHASGKRKALREPGQTLQDIKEEWNASQVSRDAWAVRVRAMIPRSPDKLRARASSDSSVPSSYLSE